MKVIVVSGTPGSGKTTFAKKFAKQHAYKYISVGYLITKHKLGESYDKKKKTKVVDIKKLNQFLIDFIKKAEKVQKEKGLAFDSHLAHYLPKKYVNTCYITHCSLPTLKKRLKKRRYSLQKIKDNLEAEIFDTCLIEAQEQGHKIKKVNTDDK